MTELKEDEVRCPYCAEAINKEAVVCWKCRNGLVNPDGSRKVVSTGDVLGLTDRSQRLKKAVTDYMTAGWFVSGSTSDSVQMAERKQFNWPIFIALCVVGIFTAFIPPLIYWIWYLIQKPNLIVLTIDADNKTVLRNGFADPGPNVMPTQGQTNLFGGAKTQVSQSQAITSQTTVATRELTPEEIAKNRANTKKVLIMIGAIIGSCFLIYLCVAIVGALGRNNIPAAFLPTIALLV